MRWQQLCAVLGWIALAHDARGASAQADAEAQRRALVLASFTGGQITVGDMEDAIANKLPETRAQLATPEARARFLRDLIDYELLRREAQRRGFATHTLVEEARDRAAIEKLVAARFPYRPEAVSAEQVARDFEAHARQHDRPAQRRASQIVVADEATARALIKELSRGDRNAFARAARERSLDAATRTRGGDLGHFDPEGRIEPGGAEVVPKTVAQATFALQRKGQVARQPIAVPGGYSVVIWTDETPAVRTTLDQVESRIRDQRAKERVESELNALVTELRSSLVKEIHAELVDPVQLDPVTPPDIPSGFPAAPPDPTAPPVLVPPDDI